jgi:hypothetical protein
MDKGMGVVADVLVQWGQLHVGDAVVIGTSFGRVKSMKDHLVRPLQCLTALRCAVEGPQSDERCVGALCTIAVLYICYFIRHGCHSHNPLIPD